MNRMISHWGMIWILLSVCSWTITLVTNLSQHESVTIQSMEDEPATECAFLTRVYPAGRCQLRIESFTSWPQMGDLCLIQNIVILLDTVKIRFDSKELDSLSFKSPGHEVLSSSSTMGLCVDCGVIFSYLLDSSCKKCQKLEKVASREERDAIEVCFMGVLYVTFMWHWIRLPLNVLDARWLSNF